MAGRIEVITGPMFCGKSKELARRIERAIYAEQRFQVFKPEMDNRAQRGLESMLPTGAYVCPISAEVNLVEAVSPDTAIVFFDEVQFIQTLEFVDQVQELACRGKTIILAGLDTDFRGKPFGIVPSLLAIADSVTKLTSICFKCKRAEGTKTWRKPGVSASAQIVVGDSEAYESRCLECFQYQE
jgi:thymidine kinase